MKKNKTEKPAVKAEDAAAVEMWAIVEIFGHQKYAGKITEQAIGGCNFVRVDVPAMDGSPAFTKLFGQGAIYSITPVEELVAMAVAKTIRAEPLNVYIPTGPSRRALEAAADDDDYE